MFRNFCEISEKIGECKIILPSAYMDETQPDSLPFVYVKFITSAIENFITVVKKNLFAGSLVTLSTGQENIFTIYNKFKTPFKLTIINKYSSKYMTIETSLSFNDQMKTVINICKKSECCNFVFDKSKNLQGIYIRSERLAGILAEIKEKCAVDYSYE